MKPAAEISGRDMLLTSRFLVLALLVLITALLVDPIAHRAGPVRISTSKIEKDFHRKIRYLETASAEALHRVSTYGWPEVLKADPGFAARYTRDDDGIALFITVGDSLVYWSDNSLVVETRDLLQMPSEVITTLPNCSVYPRVFSSGDVKVVGVVFLKKFFPYNNELVSNAFLIGGNIPSSFGISVTPIANGIPIDDANGKFSFSLVPGGELASREPLHWLTLALYFCVVFLILLFYNDLLRLAYRLRPTGWWLAALLADLILMRWLLWYFHAPHCVFNLPIFQPFGNPVLFLESRGEMLISILFLISFAAWFARYFELFPGRRETAANPNEKRLIQSLSMAGWMMSVLLFLGAVWLIRYLLLERPGLLEIYRVLTVKFPNLLDSLMVVGILVAFSLMLYRIINRIKSRSTWIQSVVGLLLVTALGFGLVNSLGHSHKWALPLFFMVLSGLMLLLLRFHRPRFNHGLVTVILVLIASFAVYSINGVNQEKEDGQHLSILNQLSSEHDQIAEMLLTQMDPDIRSDSVLAALVADRRMQPDLQQSVITNYLKNKYFGLYWNRYEIQAFSCNPASRTLIQPDNIEEGCLDFFVRDMRDKNGKLLPGTEGFYYLDNFDGVIEYLGVYDHFNRDSADPCSLIINIYARFVAQELGYPELLITGKINRDSLDQSYSYAKYHLGNLQLKSGDYDYNLTSSLYPGKMGEVVAFDADGYHHWIKKFARNNEIVISRRADSRGDSLVTFSYVFVFLFFIWLLINAFIRWRHGMLFSYPSIKQRIQFTMVAFLVFSFMLIGSGMTYYVIQQYKQSNRKLIIEKTESLLADLQGKLAKTAVLSGDWQDNSYRSLNELMIKFSYVFNTDMNIFDPHGNLIVSSRPEVFDYNLAGHKMNQLAFQAMHHEGKPRFIIRESIESLGFYSSYAPLYNQYNALIGYLNLPYFSRQSETTREISTIVIAMLNAYFILILLTVFLALILANQVSKPLQLLQSKLAALRFGKRSQTIEYQRDDEVGSLVKEYNRMVNELQTSAEKLARSERESAWREMARQIAHEIKNPLTPMKLTVQHLRRAWKDKAPDLDNHIDRTTNTLIDQIDTLSNIANEFSKFAQVPGAHFEAIDLVQKIQRITHLFEDTCRIHFHRKTRGQQEIIIFADPEQVIQVFNNIIRNALQAVPEDADPQLDIELESGEQSVVVKVTDNGTGIPEELHSRLFEPNFTTKTSGMGLGLAIAKKIMEGSQGKIWFETRRNGGTTFFLEWPLYKQE
jgi:two-component system nitrogen regulation sensor histidine kinase NtrY